MKKLVLGSSILLASLLMATGKVSADTIETKEIKHEVVAGDTLSHLAEKYKVEIGQIASKNKIENIDLIFIGQELIIDSKAENVLPEEKIVYAETPEQVYEEEYVEPYVEQYVEQPTTNEVTGNYGSVEYAAQKMANATGLSYDTWHWIIMAESGGNPTITNPIGCYGYFQIHPVHGMPHGADVDTQIQYAINIYNSQGLGAWEVTH